jgi:carboxypeptidase Q
VLLAANAMAALTAIEGDLKKLVQYIVSGPGRGDAYNRTAKFVDEFGHRHSCSESLKMSLEELKRTLEAEFGEKNVKKFPVPNVPKWVRGKEACTLLSPPLRQGTVPALNRSIEILGLGFSVGTNNSVLEAPVVVVGSLDELVEKRELVRGKIVVFDMPYQGYGKTRPYRTHCASFCAKFGARALLLRSITPWSLKTPHTGALTYRQDLRPDLRTLDRKTADGLGFGKGGVPDELLGDYSSVAKIPAAAITLEDAAMLRRMTAREPEDPVVVRLEMEARTEGTCTSHNMIAEVRGSEKPDEVVVVSGHWDSWDVGQGAMDDAGPAFTALQV